MKSSMDEEFAQDTTPSRTVVEDYRTDLAKVWESGESPEASLALVHWRGGQEEFELGLEYSRSANPLDRAVGAIILGQLGWGRETFLDESVEILISLLEDPDIWVINEAATALGHRNDPRAVPHLVKLAEHSSEDVRVGVAFGLGRHEDPAAIRAQIQLSKDSDRDVRSWAMFGLGSLIETDTPEIREALFAGLEDEDDEVRGEALVGLAERHTGDPRVRAALLKEWENENVNVFTLETAEHLADSSLLPYLESYLKPAQEEGDSYFQSRLRDAIKACAPKPEKESDTQVS